MIQCRRTIRRHLLYQLSTAKEARSMDRSRALHWKVRMILPLFHQFLANEIVYWTVIMTIVQEMRQKNLLIWCNRKQLITSVRQRLHRHWDVVRDRILLKLVGFKLSTSKKVVVKVNLRLLLVELWITAKHSTRLLPRKANNKPRWVSNSSPMTSFSRKSRQFMTFTSNMRRWNRSKMENVPNLRPESPKSSHRSSTTNNINSNLTRVNAVKLSKSQAKPR